MVQRTKCNPKVASQQVTKRRPAGKISRRTARYVGG